MIYVPIVVNACCVLHNMCEVHGDGFDDEWLNEEEEVSNSPSTIQSSMSTARSDAIRNALCDYFDQ